MLVCVYIDLSNGPIDWTKLYLQFILLKGDVNIDSQPQSCLSATSKNKNKDKRFMLYRRFLWTSEITSRKRRERIYLVSDVLKVRARKKIGLPHKR